MSPAGVTCKTEARSPRRRCQRRHRRQLVSMAATASAARRQSDRHTADGGGGDRGQGAGLAARVLAGKADGGRGQQRGRDAFKHQGHPRMSARA